LVAIQPRAYKRTTVSGEHPLESPDLLERDFTAGPDGGAAGERLVGDITYLKTGEGWLYLATVIDLATRMVVGWQMTTHMRTPLIIDALQMAVDAGHLRRDAIFHSDRGTHIEGVSPVLQEQTRPPQHRAHRRVLGQRRRRLVLRVVENEMYYRHSWPTRARARFAVAVADYIEVFYNRQRLHSTLGYRTPHEALTDYQTAATAA
jgi:putative transposase